MRAIRSLGWTGTGAALPAPPAAPLVPRARFAGPMRWVIAIMVALTVIAGSAGLALSNTVDRAAGELARGATVQIVQADPAARAAQVTAARRVLARDARVTSLRVVPQAELEELLEPWLGDAAGAGAVPVPALIDLRLRGPATPVALDDLRQALARAAPDARIDAQADWLAPVFSALRSLQALAIALVLLLALTSAAAVWMASRSALSANRETVEIVHLLGGTDGQIAGIFQRSIALDAAIGGAAGLALGIAAVLLLGSQFAALGSGMTQRGVLGPGDWLLLALVPLAGTALAVLTTRLTVFATLRRMP